MDLPESKEWKQSFLSCVITYKPIIKRYSNGALKELSYKLNGKYNNSLLFILSSSKIKGERNQKLEPARTWWF